MSRKIQPAPVVPFTSRPQGPEKTSSPQRAPQQRTAFNVARAYHQDAFIGSTARLDRGTRLLGGAGPVVRAAQTSGSSSPGQQIFDAAKSYEGKATGDLILDAKTWHYQKKPGDTKIGEFMDPSIDPIENCANFVGGILKQTGLADKGTRMFSVYDIDNALSSKQYQDRGWKTVDGPAVTDTGKKSSYQEGVDFFKNAQPPFKPGDVVTFRTGESDYGHVVIFAGMNDKGEPTFIGSNNVLKVDNKGQVLGVNGQPLNPQPSYPNPETGDQQISTVTLEQLYSSIGSNCAVRHVFRAPESTPKP
jgi:hypothetical protein